MVGQAARKAKAIAILEMVQTQLSKTKSTVKHTFHALDIDANGDIKSQSKP